MSKRFEKISIGGMSPGTARHVVAHRYGTAGARPKAYIQAAIHADEIPAIMAAHHLIRRLDEAEAQGGITGEIVVVPAANPIGLGQNINGVHAGRSDLRGGGNFNRHWPDLSEGLAAAVEGKLGADAARNVAAIRAAMGERLARMTADAEFARLRLALYRLAHDADFVLDLHCDDDALMHLYLTDEFWPDGADLAAETGARAVFLSSESGGGAFTEPIHLAFRNLARHFGGRYPIPNAAFTATLEHRGEADVHDSFGARDADALFRFLQRRGMIAGDPGPLPPLLCEATPLDGTDYTQVPMAGVVAYRVKPGDTVRRGDVVAEIIDPMAEHQAGARTPVHAVTDGLILSLCQRKLVAAGDYIATVVGKESLEHRRKGALLVD